jgi:hypothetical protein
MFMPDLSASQTDKDEGVIKHDDKNQFTFPRWKSLHKLNTETLVSADHNAWFWWYGVYDETGMEGSHQGKIKSCIKCHTQAKETDYMFSESVIESINEEEW